MAETCDSQFTEVSVVLQNIFLQESNRISMQITTGKRLVNTAYSYNKIISIAMAP